MIELVLFYLHQAELEKDLRICGGRSRKEKIRIIHDMT